jgi:hypothetical protein
MPGKHHFKLGFASGLPDMFVEPLGQVMVQFAFMDAELQRAILALAKLDHNAGISIFAKVQQTGARIEILQNLATTKIKGVRRRSKVLTLVDELVSLAKERNIVAHTLPYSWDATLNELAYYRETSLTSPQISAQPPLLVTPDTLKKLALGLRTCAMWLAMLRLHHPDWNKDAQFPWRDKFRRKVARENQILRNNRQKQKAQRKSYSALRRSRAKP